MSTSHESALDPASQVTLIEQAKAAAEIAAGIKQAIDLLAFIDNNVTPYDVESTLVRYLDAASKHRGTANRCLVGRFGDKLHHISSQIAPEWLKLDGGAFIVDGTTVPALPSPALLLFLLCELAQSLEHKDVVKDDERHHCALSALYIFALIFLRPNRGGAGPFDWSSSGWERRFGAHLWEGSMQAPAAQRDSAYWADFKCRSNYKKVLVMLGDRDKTFSPRVLWDWAEWLVGHDGYRAATSTPVWKVVATMQTFLERVQRMIVSSSIGAVRDIEQLSTFSYLPQARADTNGPVGLPVFRPDANWRRKRVER